MYAWDNEVNTFITKWSHELMNFSIPTVFFPLTAEERDQFLTLMFPEKETEEVKKVHSYFSDKISPAFEEFPDGIFLRNDRRSPKDSDSFFTRDGIVAAKSPEQAIGFCLYSERMYMDFKDAQRWNHLPVLVARKWMELKREREFRCFVKEGRLFAITQYDYHDSYVWVLQNETQVLERIKTFFEQIREYLPCSTIVFDVHVGDDNVLLIETNPYRLSDPCLFENYKELYSLYEHNPEITMKVKAESSKKKEEDTSLSSIFSELE
ncbi:ATP-grasp domain-containing protein [Brevibacillus sp. NPDC058079]|uniref:ATP-grasp domain-containing protein n=1 Tax=Brevibacillus sp. NPDC058079 TaxID=3346330 RepID=UPI0036E2E12F